MEKSVQYFDSSYDDFYRIDKKTIAVIFLFASVFFLSGHNVSYPILERLSSSAEAYERAIVEGSLKREVAFIALGLFALAALIVRGGHRFRIRGSLGWLMAFFIAWSFFTIIWSVDPQLTVRRLGVFFILCLAAVGAARLFPLSVLTWCALWVTTFYLLIGLTNEVFLGTFHPLTPEYRFAGTLHPNIQGINCAIMLLSAVSLAQQRRHDRFLLLCLASVAIIGLILTKSRTSFVCALLSIVIFSIEIRNKKWIFSGIFVLIWIFLFMYVFSGDTVKYLFEKMIFLGRGDQDLFTFNGRKLIWEMCMQYIAQRPFLGYGFNTFWIPAVVGEFSDAVGTGIIGAHSAYLDIILNIGLVGLTAFILILIVGIWRYYSIYKKERNIGSGFMLMLFIFFAFDGVLESYVAEMSSFGTFLLLWGLIHLGYRKIPTEKSASLGLSFREEKSFISEPHGQGN